MAILSFFTNFQKKNWKNHFWSVDPILWPRMMVFGYMMPKDIRIDMNFENLNFIKNEKKFSIWVLKPHMWLSLRGWSKINKKVTPFWKIQVESNILGQFTECRFFASITYKFWLKLAVPYIWWNWYFLQNKWFFFIK